MVVCAERVGGAIGVDSDAVRCAPTKGLGVRGVVVGGWGEAARVDSLVIFSTLRLSTFNPSLSSILATGWSLLPCPIPGRCMGELEWDAGLWVGMVSAGIFRPGLEVGGGSCGEVRGPWVTSGGQTGGADTSVGCDCRGTVIGTEGWDGGEDATGWLTGTCSLGLPSDGRSAGNDVARLECAGTGCVGAVVGGSTGL